MTSRLNTLAVFTPIQDPGRAEIVAQRLTDAILLGVLREGDRLPSEASLGQQFGVATVTARDALEVLRDRGLITTRRGRGGGSFVTRRPGMADEHDLSRFASTSRTELRDMAVHYSAIVSHAAGLAATRMSDDQVSRLTALVAEIDYDDEVSTRRGEAVLRIEVAALTRSPRLVREELRLQVDVGPVLWVGFGDGDCRAQVRAAHAALLAALAARDADAASASSRTAVTALVEAAVAFKGEAPTAQQHDLEEVLALFRTTVEKWARRVGAAYVAGGADVLDTIVATTVRDVLELDDRIVDGAGFISTPAAGREEPWYVGWWSASEAGAIRVLMPQTGPLTRRYTQMEWWREAISAAGGKVIGPYVDYPGTGESVVSVTAPVLVDGVVVGVMAADVPTARLERLVGKEIG